MITLQNQSKKLYVVSGDRYFKPGASIAFAVNENLSISYGQIDTELDGQTNDEELKGFSIGYSMGGITIKAHQNKGENMDGDANNESEHTEVSVSFAF